MGTELVSLSAVSIVLVPVVLALTQVVKMFIKDTRWMPVASLILGILAAFVVPQSTVILTILQGILIGLSASGLFSGSKAMFTSTATA